MQIDPYTMEQIAISDPFVCLLPDGAFEGTEGDAHLRYAVSLGIHVVVLRYPDRWYLPIPKALADYDDYIVIDGTMEDLKDAMLHYWEAAPADEVIIHNKGYH